MHRNLSVQFSGFDTLTPYKSHIEQNEDQQKEGPISGLVQDQHKRIEFCRKANHECGCVPRRRHRLTHETILSEFPACQSAGRYWRLPCSEHRSNDPPN